MKRVSTWIYSLMPIPLFLLLYCYYQYRQQAAIDFTQKNEYFICFILVGLITALGVMLSQMIDEKTRVIITIFWMLVIPILYALLYAGVLPYFMQIVLISAFNIFLLLEGVYLAIILWIPLSHKFQE